MHGHTNVKKGTNVKRYSCFMSPNFGQGCWMFRSSIMKLGWWKCGKYESSWLWGVYIFDDVRNILGTSYITLWHMNQKLRKLAAKFVPVCWRMARHKTNLLCARAYKNRPKRKEASILSSEQDMKAGFVVMTQEQSNSHASGRVILLPSKRVEADEVRLQDHVICFLEQWGISSEGVLFFSASLWINSSA